MRMFTLAALAAALLIPVSCAFADGPKVEQTAAAEVRTMTEGGLTLSLPASIWPDTHAESGAPGETIHFFQDIKKNPSPADVGTVSSKNPSGATFDDAVAWANRDQLPGFLKWAATDKNKHRWPLKELTHAVTDLKVGSVPVKRIDLQERFEDGPNKGLVTNLTVLVFVDKAGKDRHTIFVYNVGMTADLTEMVKTVVSGISWTS